MLSSNLIKSNKLLFLLPFGCYFLWSCNSANLSEQTHMGANSTPEDTTTTSFLAASAPTPDELAAIMEPEPAQELETLQEAADPAPTPLWRVYRENIGLNLDQDNPRIKKERDWYAKHQYYFDRVLKRAEPYLYHVLNQAVERGLPSELALLPIVESAYDPFAYSHGRAAGMWQFVPGTARGFGLKQTWWYEGRRDVVASTKAALDYLESLNKRFEGDWMLALASYNSGAGTVRKAMRKNRKRGKPTDFWSLNLPKETRAYVPKLIAISQLFKRPEKYNFELQDMAYEPYFEEVDIGGQLDLALASKMAGISIEELYKLNPAFNRWATDPDGPHRLLVPVDQAEQIKAELAEPPPEKRVSWQRYTIKPGDSIGSISQAHKITPALLREVNHLRSDTIRAGKALLIPKSSQPLENYTLSADARQNQRLEKKRAGKLKIIHVVSNGESFWTIGKKYGVNHNALARWNALAPNDTLKVGRKLVVWKKPKVNLDGINQQRLRKIYYKARYGDSYSRIADRFNISLNQLKNWNGVDFKSYLQPGDMLTLYVDVANAP